MNKTKIDLTNVGYKFEFPKKPNPSTPPFYPSFSPKRRYHKNGKRLRLTHDSSPPLFHANVHCPSRPGLLSLYHDCCRSM